jgi:Plasmid encoded RepA protein
LRSSSSQQQGLLSIPRRIVEAGAKIVEEQPDHLEFLHSVFCQVGMPRKQMDTRIFERSSGRIMLRLEAGALFNGRQFVEQPLPYGVKPRLMMVHICSEAVRTQSREIEIGHSAHEFMKTLGLDTNGENYAMTRKQIMALAACRLTLGYTTGHIPKTLNMQPVEKFEAWLHPTGQQATLWPGKIVLSTPFYETILEYPVPLEHRALAALKHSALAIDVYTWLANRLCRVRKSEGVKVSWANLRDQFGQEYSDPKNFKRELRQVLRQVLGVYPSARVESISGGLLLKASPPPIPKTHVVVKLP